MIGASIPAWSAGIQSWLGNKRAKENRNNQREWDKDMWEMENAYNTPLEQRKRLEAAGLNPMQMYGHGSVANTGGNVATSAIDQPQMNIAEGITEGLALYQNWQMQSAQKSLLAEQAEVARTTAELNKANADKSRSETNWTNWQIGKDQGLFETTLQGAQLDNKNKEQEIRGKMLSNTGSEFDNLVKKIEAENYPQQVKLQLQMATKQIEKTVNDIATSKTQQNLNRLEAAIKNYEVQLNKLNLSKGDNVTQRLMAIAAEKLRKEVEANGKKNRQKQTNAEEQLIMKAAQLFEAAKKQGLLKEKKNGTR